MTLPEVSSSGGAAEALICHSTRVLEPEKAFPSNMETKASQEPRAEPTVIHLSCVPNVHITIDYFKKTI